MNKINRIRYIATAAVFCLFVGFFALSPWLMPDSEYSVYERRPLEQMPVWEEAESVGEYIDGWDAYLTDQFTFRDPFRFLKSMFGHSVLLQTDVNGYYSEDGMQAELLYPMNRSNIRWNLALMEEIRRVYFPSSPAYAGVIPDKSYYMDAPLGLDYAEIDRFMADLLQAKAIPLRDLLTLDDYYATDIHWKQENLSAVYERLRANLQGELPPFAEAGFAKQTAGSFYGVLYGQAALPAQKDTMCYLTTASIEALQVQVLDTGKSGSVYDTEAFAGDDAYDLYLGGEAALIRITNPDSTSGKKLILFRDSFGRSIAPLLAAGYDEIVLVDLRWIRPAYLASFSDLLQADENTDLLFLYSAQVLHSVKLG